MRSNDVRILGNRLGHDRSSSPLSFIAVRPLALGALGRIAAA
jgi:hypothetical protein